MYRNKKLPLTEDIELIRVFASITDENTMRSFFREIFTRSEINDFSLRWKLMKQLKAGHPQRKIAASLGISLCKITRGAKILKDKTTVTNRFIEPSASRRSNG
jgi:TrpR family trp operon transcriptional repressor